jgi:cyclic pyranopterin phosphate synthase
MRAQSAGTDVGRKISRFTVTELVQLSSPRTIPPAPESGPLTDTFGRIHDNLRISVTDRCNIRCFYCMPEDARDFTPSANQLTFPEITRFVSIAQLLGVKKVRLTGGEPLLRRDLPRLIAELSKLGLDELALTTNGVALATHAQTLYDAGLRRLNVHLDSLDRDRFRQITRRDDLPRVLNGIDVALETGFSVKLNAVAIKDLTEPDVIPLAHFARERHLEIRYIEFMPLDAQDLWSKARVLTADDMISMLASEFGPLLEVPDADPRAPATEYKYCDGGGKVGFIASVSRPFCLNCNRLRLTADGKLRYCLFAREEFDVRNYLRSGDAEGLIAAIRSAVWQKWPGHQINSPVFAAPSRPMYSIGG